MAKMSLRRCVSVALGVTLDRAPSTCGSAKAGRRALAALSPS